MSSSIFSKQKMDFQKGWDPILKGPWQVHYSFIQHFIKTRDIEFQ
jgi:hypothetical protein